MNKIEFKQFLQNTKDNIQEKLNPKKIGTKISVSLKSKKTRKNLIIYAFLTLFCIAFLLLLSASTSPPKVTTVRRYAPIQLTVRRIFRRISVEKVGVTVPMKIGTK